MELDFAMAAAAFGEGWFNLLRRGADGSLVLSADRWRLARLNDDAFFFTPDAAEAEPVTLPLGEVARVSWDRLPRQQARSQLRFLLRGGDLWTFSGSVDAAMLPAAP